MKKTKTKTIGYTLLVSLLFSFLMLSGCSRQTTKNSIPIQIEESIEGAPITLGIPFAQGTLNTTDNIRLLDDKGKEIPCQVTEVSTWAPLDLSVKWIWVFFFATDQSNYQLEYGEGICRAPIKGPRIKFKNSQRQGSRGFAEIDTGPLYFKVKKGPGGFMESVMYDVTNDDLNQKDTIAVSPQNRGSFLDMLDDAGIDASKASVSRTVREKGSGPLHAILRVEGNYEYGRSDNETSPFVMRIHAFAGKSFIKVLHTFTYTGTPDKHTERSGIHPAIAIMDSEDLITERVSSDKGWMEPNDQIANVGLGLNYHLNENLQFTTSYYDGSWRQPGNRQYFSSQLQGDQKISVYQNGPQPKRIPPLESSGPEKVMGGFEGGVSSNGKNLQSFEKAGGWMDLSDDKWGIAVGMRNFLEEYPKDISIDPSNKLIDAHIWSPDAGTMSFERANLRSDAGLLDNYATGLTKTTELVYHFHDAGLAQEEISTVMDYFLDPPAAHASPETYSNSKVYGSFSPYHENHEDFERGLEYKFDWISFSEKWEPWYGLLDYGDHMRFFFNNNWSNWNCNEPATDFMYWMQYMRTGDRKYYLSGEAASRHTMDIDNIHWPNDPPYIGDTNEAIDFWQHGKEKKATPFLGVGRRHANQHYSALLSAHVWVPGWLASYYLTGYHRGLDIAKLTADSHTRRIWGEHGLTGRRLYLSVWNLVEVWDATKEEKYYTDLKDRVDRMLKLQAGCDQYNSLVMDRYGYSQCYVTRGLSKYLQMTQDERVRHALILHAQTLRDNANWNHEYESYFASISALVLGYELCGEESLLREAVKRAEQLRTDELKQSFEELKTQKAIALALEEASNLPGAENYAEGAGHRATIWGMTMGLRIFGWTHFYNVPWLLEHIDDLDE